MPHRQFTLFTVLIATMSLFAADPYPAVDDFQLDRYLGTWYEIARMDHSFERGLSNVTASYSMKDASTVKVLNKGYNEVKQRWSDATGSAKFAGDPDVGRLKVTFFWPFYGGYNIMELTDDYSLALVAGDSPKYLWILSRKPTLTESEKHLMLERASEEGFAIDDLIWVDQSKHID